MNPDPDSEGLKLNISATDNTQDLELVQDVAQVFRVPSARAAKVIDEVLASVRTWRTVATTLGLSPTAISRMQRAFRVADR